MLNVFLFPHGKINLTPANIYNIHILNTVLCFENRARATRFQDKHENRESIYLQEDITRTVHTFCVISHLIYYCILYTYMYNYTLLYMCVCVCVHNLVLVNVYTVKDFLIDSIIIKLSYRLQLNIRLLSV